MPGAASLKTACNTTNINVAIATGLLPKPGLAPARPMPQDMT